jgi:hypothetical protein
VVDAGEKFERRLLIAERRSSGGGDEESADGVALGEGVGAGWSWPGSAGVFICIVSWF